MCHTRVISTCCSLLILTQAIRFLSSNSTQAPAYAQFERTHGRPPGINFNGLDLIVANAADSSMAELIRRSSHIYMFDAVFMTEATAKIMRMVAASAFTMLITCQRPATLQAIGVEFNLLHSIPVHKSYGGGNHTMYFYVRADADQAANPRNTKLDTNGWRPCNLHEPRPVRSA